MEDGTARVTRNIAFNSPSAAAAVVAGRQANGRESWKLKKDTSISYATWQEQQLDQVIDLANNAVV